MLSERILPEFIKAQKGKNIFLVFVVICLILGEKFVETDFVCPCEKYYTEAFFWIYLLMPAFVSYTIVLCMLKNMDLPTTATKSTQTMGPEPGTSSGGQAIPLRVMTSHEELKDQPEVGTSSAGTPSASDGDQDNREQGKFIPKNMDVPTTATTSSAPSQSRSPEPGTSSGGQDIPLIDMTSHEEQTDQPEVGTSSAGTPSASNGDQDHREQDTCKCSLKCVTESPYVQSLMSVIIWIILFFSDGRYIACYKTVQHAEYADSNQRAYWEWCDRNRTLTKDQYEARKAFFTSKLSGFAVIFLISAGLLFHQLRCQCNKKAAVQTDTTAQQSTI